jgi:hypothetical protein
LIVLQPVLRPVRALLVVLAEALRKRALQPAMADVNERSVGRLAHNIRQGISRGEIRSNVDVQAQATSSCHRCG